MVMNNYGVVPSGHTLLGSILVEQVQRETLMQGLETKPRAMWIWKAKAFLILQNKSSCFAGDK